MDTTLDLSKSKSICTPDFKIQSKKKLTLKYLKET